MWTVWTRVGRRISLTELPDRALARVPWLAVWAVVMAGLFSARTAHFLRYNVPDDAVTSMQYAKNLALGHGLVFNVGERVDGYTNFLWVIVMTPVYAFCRWVDLPFVPVMVWAGIVLAATSVGLVYLVGKSLWGRSAAIAIATLVCVFDRSFTTWAALGLEVHLLAALMLLALWLHRSDVPHRGLYLGLSLLGAHLTRPDAALFAASLLGSGLVAAALAWRRRDPALCRRELVTLAVAAAVWLVPYAAYFAWHYAYYGAPFPNTYYVKLGGSIDGWARGAAYLRGFFDQRAWLPALAVLALLGARDKTVLTLVAYLPLHLAYVAYAGGDFMAGHRFLMPQVPLFGLLLGEAAIQIWKASNRIADRLSWNGLTLSRDHLSGFGAALVLCALAVLSVRTRGSSDLDAALVDWREPHERQKKLLTWLRDVKPPNATFATGLIGHTGFYADIRVIDTFGIIDPLVAKRQVKDFGRGHAGHEKAATVDEVLAKKPTYIGIYVLATDLWKRGYYLDTGVPRDTVPGIWVRDRLTERGRLVLGTGLDFDKGREGGFVAVGRAFEHWPAKKNEKGQGVVEGAEGGFLNSFHESLDCRATGTLTSAPFALRGDRLVFRIAGGDDTARLSAELRVDGTVVRRATGKNTDVMGRVSWDIRPFKDKQGTLVLRDASSEPWGYIAVDSVAQWTDG